jgi:hypothetical protein
VAGPALRPLMGGHRSIGDRRSPMAYEFTRQDARGSGLAASPEPSLGGSSP